MADFASPDACAQALAASFDKQAEVYTQILTLSQKQQTLVDERREGELLSLLNDKQRLIEKHQKLAAEAQNHRIRWETLRAQASPDARARVEAAFENLRSILEQVMSFEDASREKLQQQKGEVSMDINRLQKGRILNKAYGGGYRPPPAARYSDRQG